jgi:hypothetical protein
VIGRTRPPRACQNQQRRNDREEKKDVIEIQEESEVNRYIVAMGCRLNIGTILTL